MSDDQAYSEPWHIRNGLFKHFQGYWYIFSHTHRGVTKGERGDFHCLFWKLKKVFWFWKFQILHSKYSLRVSRRKSSTMFPCWAFFLVFLTRYLSSALVSQTYLKSCETLTEHIQNRVIGHYSARNLAYSESYSQTFHNCISENLRKSHIYENLWIFRTLNTRISQ